MFLGQTGYVSHTVTNDSLVEGRICRVLECTRTYEYNGNVLTTGFYPFHYCVYDSGGGVFINVPGQGFDTLYVMDALPGDRWSLVPFPADCDSIAFMEVLDTGHVQINGQSLRWLAVDRHFPGTTPPWVLPDTIVEQLGSKSYLTPQVGCPQWDMVVSGHPLWCYQSDQLSYQAPGIEDCEPNLGIADHREKGDVDAIWVDGILTISSVAGPIRGIELFDGVGHQVLHTRSTSGKIVLDLSWLQNGLYLYRVVLDGWHASGTLIR
jgi:hypothetical protein